MVEGGPKKVWGGPHVVGGFRGAEPPERRKKRENFFNEIIGNITVLSKKVANFSDFYT